MRQLAMFLDQQPSVPGDEAVARARALDDLDADTVRRFGRKLAPWPDADGHRW